ncbi:hypothetical protein [Streptomyces sp. NPDC002250]|uniref:hypothetical protein n=1 Tax=Streptomyces sp. NPDC002250 TaxID=3364641 RepID=UPI003679E458
MSFLDKAARVLAPGTLVIGLLYFFGSTYTDTYYSFFGVPPRDLQFSVQGYLVNSPRAIFVPMWVLFFVGLGLAMLLLLINHVLAGPRKAARRRVVARWFYLPGMAVVLLIPLILPESVAQAPGLILMGEPLGLWAPLVLALGATLSLFGLRLRPGDWGSPDKRAPTGRRVWFVAEVMMGGHCEPADRCLDGRSLGAAVCSGVTGRRRAVSEPCRGAQRRPTPTNVDGPAAGQNVDQ